VTANLLEELRTILDDQLWTELAPLDLLDVLLLLG